MKGLTNKVLVALSLLSVAGPVFGNDSTLSAGIDRGLEGLSEVANLKEFYLEEEKNRPRWVLYCADKHPNYREKCLAAGIDLTSLGMDVGLKDLADVARLKKYLLEEAKNDPGYVLYAANRYSICRKECLAAGIDLTSLGVTVGLKNLSEVAEAKMNADINSGLNGLSDLAKTLSTSTLSQRLAMKDGLVNKAKEIIRTVGAGKLALGATAIAGLGLYKLYNTETVQKWLKKDGKTK